MPEAKTLFNFDGLTPVELDAKRREILSRAEQKFDPSKGHKQKFEGLDENDLAELAVVCATLRRRSSGPPKDAKARSAPVKKQSLNDLLGDI